jgi:mitochondrial FAD-linked sulfhydryl oxidase
MPLKSLKFSSLLLKSSLLVVASSVTHTCFALRPTFTTCPEVACKSNDELNEILRSENVTTQRRQIRDPPRRTDLKNEVIECPPMREQLGQATWTFLHSMAAYYPESPSDEEKKSVAGLIKSLELLYPCSHCRQQFQIDIQTNPPRLNSRTEFSMWLCEQHNLVNELIGKPLFPCNMKEIDERWRYGKPSCWNNKTESAPESLGQIIAS